MHCCLCRDVGILPVFVVLEDFGPNASPPCLARSSLYRSASVATRVSTMQSKGAGVEGEARRQKAVLRDDLSLVLFARPSMRAAS